MTPSVRILTTSRAALLQMLADNEAASVDRIGRTILDGLDEDARRYLRLIDGELARHCPDAAFFGSNGGVASVAAVEDLVRQSARQRELGSVKVRRVA